jgi:hypothetical protein
MSQATDWSVPLSGPVTPNAMADRMDKSFDALLSSHSGASRPAYAVAGTEWVSTATAGLLKYYVYDGTDDRLIKTIDIATGIVTFAAGITDDALGKRVRVDAVQSFAAAQQAQARTNISAALKGHIYGLTLSNNASDAANDIDIAAGEAASTGTDPVLMVLASALTKRLDAAWAVGTGNGGLDTGSIANGWYYVWLIRRSDTGVVDVLFSASATSPTMPANYDQKRRIGAFERASGAIRAFLQIGDRFLLGSQLVSYSNTNLPTTKTTAASGAPTGIRTTAILNVRASRGGGSLGVSVWCPDLATPTTINGGTSPLSNGSNELNASANLSTTAVSIGTNLEVMTDATGNIALQCADATTQVGVTLVGWIDARGTM